jgi:hypothetical protein
MHAGTHRFLMGGRLIWRQQVSPGLTEADVRITAQATKPPRQRSITDASLGGLTRK